jgi:hypothetical protein
MKSLGNCSKRLRNPESKFEGVVLLQLYVVELKWSSKLFVVVCLPRAREAAKMYPYSPLQILSEI